MSAPKTMKKDEKHHLRTLTIVQLVLSTYRWILIQLLIPKKNQNEKDANDEMFSHFENLTGQPMSH